MDHFSSAPFESIRLPFYHPHTNAARPRVAVSACLAGERVRYDGASRDLPALSWLDGHVQLVPICPEVDAGLAVPRPPVQLIAGPMEPGTVSEPRARGRDDPALDVTDALKTFAHDSLASLEAAGSLCGYVFKSRSPSCGLDSTPLFDGDGRQVAITSGIQAAAFQRHLPWLGYCEETTLVDRTAALAFALRCRLVFDWLYAGDTSPARLLQHYRSLFERLGVDVSGPIVKGDATAGRAACLTELQRHCARMPPTRLLEAALAWAP